MIAQVRDVLVILAATVGIAWYGWSWAEANLIAKLQLRQQVAQAEQRAAKCR